MFHLRTALLALVALLAAGGLTATSATAAPLGHCAPKSVPFPKLESLKVSPIVKLKADGTPASGRISVVVRSVTDPYDGGWAEVEMTIVEVPGAHVGSVYFRSNGCESLAAPMSTGYGRGPNGELKLKPNRLYMVRAVPGYLENFGGNVPGLEAAQSLFLPVVFFWTTKG